MSPTKPTSSETLKAAREHLIANLLSNEAPNFPKHYTRVLDNYFYESFERSAIGAKIGIIKNPYAIVALGGYGREEQCVRSDVDLLFLFEKSVPSLTEELIQEMIYPLWDIGLEASHATRSIKECLEIAQTDIEVLTSLLDARFICGNSLVYQKFMDQFRQKVIEPKSDRFINLLLETNRKRHERFGDSTYLLEPNLKEGEGGLRDYHTILWIARIRHNIREPRDLEFYGCLAHDEFKTLNNALIFIWYVRNCLHHLTKRKCDQLYFEHQEKLAEFMGYQKKNGQQPVEHFLGDLHGQMEYIRQQHVRYVYELENTKTLKGKKTQVIPCRIAGLSIRRGTLNFNAPEEIVKSPVLLMRIFEESARKRLPLSLEARRLVKDFLHLADEDFQKSPAVVKSFEKVLTTLTPRFNPLHEMFNTGFLVKFIPEFDGIVNRIQYDEYHLYPVDRHSLRTVRTIKRFGTPEDVSSDPLYGSLYKELPGKVLLLWAALLHDIGKQFEGGGHARKGESVARHILQEKGYAAEDVETVAFLVREHLLLVETATKRDITDEDTVIQCARQIRDVNSLKMLYLLTVADCISTGPKAWNEWIATLLKDLFLSIVRILEKGELATRETGETIEKKKAAVLLAAASPEERQIFESTFSVMRQRYLLAVSPQDIVKHIRLFQQLKDKPFVWHIDHIGSEFATRTVTVCARSKPGLFSKFSGVLTLNGVNIRNAQIYTWKNDIAVDIFTVDPPVDKVFESEKWERATEHLATAISGHLDLASALKERLKTYGFIKHHIKKRPHKINIDNESSRFFTIVEVYTYDAMGLLYRLTDALYRCRIDIRVAIIATKVDQVVDIFYVRDIDGNKADSPEQVGAIKTEIEKVLSEIEKLGE